MSVPILKSTKIGELLKAYPHLEEALVGLSPEFARLKNPILRKTVAQLATIEKAAQIAGIDVEKMLSALRESVGGPAQPAGRTEPEEDSCSGCHDVPPAKEAGLRDEPRPDWMDRAKVGFTVNADEMLARGVHPLELVMQKSRELKPGGGEAVVLASSFLPVPLIDLLRSKGFRTYSDTRGPEAYRTYITAA